MNKKVIFNQKLAGFLMMRGFVLHGLEKSHFDNRRNVFIFNQSENIEKTIQEFKR
ncbi:DUF5659 domain-containing protein [Heyndrickxia oleronia]|uniref:DUF5659 domain-containing protein n=1 Tax=Heyndrickxia oleronia TaxID=38875 RepID=UPI003F225736